MLVKNKKYLQKVSHKIAIISLLGVILFPVNANAGVLTVFTEKVKAIFFNKDDDLDKEEDKTSQNITLPKPVVVGEGDEDELTSSNNDSLSVISGPLRMSTEDIDFPTNDTISVYEVKKGDTLATVAKLFGVSKNTIIWANDLKSEKISPGDTLVILPISGIRHTVRQGDTVSSIAKRYKADKDDIAKYNGVTTDTKLAKGDVIIVPEGEIVVTETKKTSSGKVVTTNKVLDKWTTSTPDGFLIRPVANGRKTQGIHGHNGIDIGGSLGTPILASAKGTVIVAKPSGYNGGYGQMIVISHEGGIQTVYAHLRAVYVTQGQSVSQGDVIGELGNTGRSTGPHLHFEVRGAKNPF